jgi:hypothetical protein
MDPDRIEWLGMVARSDRNEAWLEERADLIHHLIHLDPAAWREEHILAARAVMATQRAVIAMDRERRRQRED